jgi:hypothetical protein
VYGDASGTGTPRWQFNKLLAHATMHRRDSHDYSRALTTVWQVLLPLMVEVMSQSPVHCSSGGDTGSGEAK